MYKGYESSWGRGLIERRNSPLIGVSIAYLISAFGISFLVFYVIFPLSNRFINSTSLNPNGSLFHFLELIPQYLAYAISTAIFYFIVVRPFRLRPLLGRAHGDILHGIRIYESPSTGLKSFCSFPQMDTP